MTEKEFRNLKGWDLIIDVLGDHWFVNDTIDDCITIQAVNSPYRRRRVDVKGCVSYYVKIRSK